MDEPVSQHEEPLGDDVVEYQAQNGRLMGVLYAVAAACFALPVAAYGRMAGAAAVTSPALLVPALVVGGAAFSCLPAVVNPINDAGERRLEFAAGMFSLLPSAAAFLVYRVVAGTGSVATAYPTLSWTTPVAALAVGTVALVVNRLR